MSIESGSPSSPNHWNAQPTIDWLLAEGRFLPTLDELIHKLGHQLRLEVVARVT